MRKTGILILSAFIICIMMQCGGKKTINMNQPPSQTSVRINLTNGLYQEGIIVTGDKDKLVYVNAETHKVDTLDTFNILNIVESEYDYDFYGNKILESEIKEHKGYKNTFLYGAGGLVLGSAVGFGAFVAILSSDDEQVTAANLAMAGLGVAGAVVFGIIGNSSDYDNAVEKARKARYKDEQIRIIEEKKKLEELKKQQEKLKKSKLKQ